MATPNSPEEWLPILLERMILDLPRTQKNIRYTNGQPDLPEMGRNLRQSWERFQRKSVTDFGGLAVTSFCDRLQLIDVAIGPDNYHPALPPLRRVMRDSGIHAELQNTIRDAESTGRGYMVVFNGKIRRASPLTCYAEPDPENPLKARAAVRITRDAVTREDSAVVWSDYQAQAFTRPSHDNNGDSIPLSTGGWQAEGPPLFLDTRVPVVLFQREQNQGLVEPHIGVIDRINLGKLQRLVTTAMQAFKQRAIIPSAAGETLPGEDEDGNAIDWGRVLEPAPGALWDIPAPINIWESAATDIRPLLDGERVDIRDFAAVTGVPLTMFAPEQQSAAGAANLPMQFVLKAKAEIKRFKPALDLAFVYALRDLGVTLPEEDTIESLWADPERVTMMEKFAAAAQAKAAGLAERTIKRDILGMSPDQIIQDETDAAADLITAGLTNTTADDSTQ